MGSTKSYEATSPARAVGTVGDHHVGGRGGSGQERAARPAGPSSKIRLGIERRADATFVPNAAVGSHLLAGQPRIHRVVIVRSMDRDQLRDQITGSKTIRTKAYPSKKTRRARYGEASAELARIPQEEVDVDVVDAIAQPCRGEVLLDTGWATHILDFANLRANGRRVLIDAKRAWSDFRTEDGRRQTFLGEIIAQAMGYDYEHYVLAHAGSQQRRDNVDEVQASRFVHVPDHLVARAVSTLARGPIALGNLAAILHPVNGRSMTYALMVRRLVEIDLDGPLGERSECRAVPPLPTAMPSIRE